jgi:hypothetical protein
MNPKPVLQSIAPAINGAITLIWFGVPSAVCYSVWQTSPDGIDTRLVRNFYGTTYTVSGLTDGLWTFWVRTVYLSNFGEVSDKQQVRVGAAPDLNIDVDSLNFKNLGIGIGIAALVGGLLFGIFKLKKHHGDTNI